MTESNRCLTCGDEIPNGCSFCIQCIEESEAEEELEKKAEEYAEKQQGVFRFLSDHIKFGFIAGAKEIQKEKQKENDELKEENEHIRRLLGTAIIVLNRVENSEVPYEKVVDNLRKLKELLGSVE